MVDVTLLGVGGTYPLPKRFLTSLYCNYNGNGVLIDAGEGTQIAMKANDISPTSISTILITHFHGDHTLGLPGVLLSMHNGGRTRPVTIIGPKGIEDVVGGLIKAAGRIDFEINFKEIEYDEQKFELDKDFYAMAFKVKHSSDVECYGFTLNVTRKREFLVDKVKEANIPLQYWKDIQSGKDVGNFKANDYLGPNRNGIKVCYSTDTRPCELLLKNAKNSDLLILEAMYLADNFERAEDKAHMLACEAMEIARRVKAPKLWLTHYSPMVTNDEIRDFADRFKNYEWLEAPTKAVHTKLLYKNNKKD